jgi:Zn-finger nucleic acid-binding protein
MKCPKCETDALDERRNGAAACAECGGMWMAMYEVPRLIEEAVAEEDFGSELYEQLAQLADPLRSHPRRSEALAFLREESDAHTAR